MFDSLFPKEWTTLQRLMWLKTNALARAVYETIVGNPVSFTAKAAPLKQLKVAFSPKQDLHGYDSPWPAGGGKNKINVVRTTMAGNGYLINLSDLAIPAGTYTVSVKPSAVANITGASFAFQDANGQSVISAIGTAMDTFTNGCTVTLSDVCSIIKLYVTLSVSTSFDEIQLEVGTSKTSFAPYSNICPILGWDSLNVEQRGKNLFDESQLLQATGWALNDSGYYFGTRGAFNNAFGSGFLNLPKFKPNTQYTLSVNGYSDSATSATIFGFKYADGTYKEVRIEGTAPTDVTLTSAAGKTVDSIYGTFGSGVNVITYLKDIMLVEGTAAAEYVSYNGRSISITLGSTVYSGVLDVVAGVGEVTMTKVTLDGSQTQQNSKYDGTYNAVARWNLSVPAEAVASITSNPNAISDKLRVTGVSYIGDFAGWSGTEALGFTFTLSQDGTRVGIAIPKSEGITSAATMNAWLAANPVTVAYELRNPIPISLTPHEVQSLAGDNTMWSDANGDLTVEYRSN